jgi:hypothetical protein
MNGPNGAWTQAEDAGPGQTGSVSLTGGLPVGATGLAPAPVPVILHIGLHKTATTWFQRQYLNALHGTGLEAVVDFPRTHGAFIDPDWDTFDPAGARDQFAPEIERAKARGVPLFISDEGLGGRPTGSHHHQSVVLPRLAAAFPDATVLCTIREQRALILSMYGQYILRGHSSRLSNFLGAGRPDGRRRVINWEFYDYARLHRHLGRVFSPARVVMAPMEWLLAAPDEVLARLTAASGAVLPPTPPGAADRRERPALAPQTLDMIRLANMAVPQDSRWIVSGKRYSPNALGYWVDKAIPRGAAKRARGRRRAMIDAAVGDRYAAANDRLARTLGLDLAAYGYTTKAGSS